MGLKVWSLQIEAIEMTFIEYLALKFRYNIQPSTSARIAVTLC